MKIIQRYVLREFLVPLFYCLVGFVSIYVLFELFSSFPRMMDAHFGFLPMIVYLGGYLSPYFHYLAPAALLLATLYTMWSMCRHSEIVAMRASGISFLSIACPLLSVALAMALFVVYVGESFVPVHAPRAAQLKNYRFETEKTLRVSKIVYRHASAFRTWNIDRIGNSDGSSLLDVRVTIDRPSGGRLKAISAKKADYLDGEWWFTDAHVQHYDATGREIATPDPEADALPLRLFGEFDERPEDFLLQNRPWKYNSISDRFRYLETHPELTEAKKADLLYDLWAQIMAPMACLVITLLAIPAGVASGRQSVSKGILGALGMYFAFYGVTIACMVVAKNGWCPPIPAAVFPSVLFLAIGVRAFLKQR